VKRAPLVLHDPVTGAELSLPSHLVTKVSGPVKVGAVVELMTGSRVFVRETPDEIERRRDA
jgi:hypothetical protein